MKYQLLAALGCVLVIFGANLTGGSVAFGIYNNWGFYFMAIPSLLLCTLGALLIIKYGDSEPSLKKREEVK